VGNSVGLTEVGLVDVGADVGLAVGGSVATLDGLKVGRPNPASDSGI
jgi:hypothetical protein